METIVEKDSPAAALILLGGLFLFFVGGGLGLAYVGGVFTGKDAVAANDKRIMEQAALKHASEHVPGSAQH
jgi:hypothetical protein